MNSRWPKSLLFRFAIGSGIGIAAIVGCGTEAPRESRELSETAENAGAKRVASTSLSQTSREPAQSNLVITVTPVDRRSLESTIAEFKGKVVLVDFWATWCLPCVEQLPHTLDLGRRLADRGLVVITVSCDEPADAEQVTKFLTSKQAAGATNLISQFGGSSKSMEEFEIATGAVPFYKLYDRTGKLQQTFGIKPSAKKQYTSADIDAAIENLLAN